MMSFFERSAFLLLISFLLTCFNVEASMVRKTHANKLRASHGKAIEKSASQDDDDDDDDDDEDEEDDDKKVEKKTEKSHLTAETNKEVDKVKQELAANMKQQLELQNKLKHLSDESKSNQEIDASAAKVTKETESPAMANMLGKMWKEMRMFETPFYAEHVEEELHRLKAQQHVLESKLATAQGKAATSAAETSEKSEEKKEPAAEKDDAKAVALVGSGGHEDCPCIGINKLEGETVATLKDGTKVPYPADLGGRCEAWDLKKHPKCPGASWCKQQWCYVDPCNCKNVGVLPKPSIYLPGAKYQGKPVHFSYATCGGQDSYSSEKEKKKTAKDIEKTCAVEVDTDKFGAENCRCIGISPQPGTTKVNIKDKMVAFPADTGAVCNAWEKDNHPDCDSENPPKWCNQQWCYVDPCSCTLPIPPKTSSYLPDSTYKGKPIYFSYATCGGKDEWTAGNEKACVHAKNGVECSRLDKCSWTGTECLGSELVYVCDDEKKAKSGSWNAKAIVALALPIVALMQ